MLVYWLVFIFLVLIAVVRFKISGLGWLIIGAILSAFIGLRYRVGGDWGSYISYLARVDGKSVIEVLTYKDPGYQLLNWFGATLGTDVWFVNLFAATVFVSGLIAFARRLPDPRVAIAVSIPYMVIVMAMGYTRQATAFGFILMALTLLIEQRLLGFVVVMAIAATFHKSAVILVPLAVVANTRDRVWTAIWVGCAGALLYVLMLQEHVDTLWENYVVSGYSQASEGGPIRVAMNALPALIFLLFYKRFEMTREERALWFWVSVLALACVPLVYQAPTAVDRVALYFMPIQLVVASHIPRFARANSRVIARVAVLGAYGLVMYVWLNFAGHRNSWIPYQFWPLA